MKTWLPILSLLLAAGAANAQGQAALEADVHAARTVAIQPHAALPEAVDFKRVQAGYAFLAKHRQFAEQIMATSSLAATFAAVDIEPILIQTGRLPNDFQKRMHETGQWMDEIFDAPKDQDDFTKREYAKAFQLGQLHQNVARLVAQSLKWDPKERVLLNGQSFAFVLYTFAWWPVEAMVAARQVDPTRDAQALDDWFYLWHVLGYGMGVPDTLLPTSFAEAGQVVTLLRKAQYTPKGAPIPNGVPILMRGHVRMIAAEMAEQSQKKPEAMTDAAVKALAGALILSPGEIEALGLAPNPVTKLTTLAQGH